VAIVIQCASDTKLYMRMRHTDFRDLVGNFTPGANLKTSLLELSTVKIPCVIDNSISATRGPFFVSSLALLDEDHASLLL